MMELSSFLVTKSLKSFEQRSYHYRVITTEWFARPAPTGSKTCTVGCDHEGDGCGKGTDQQGVNPYEKGAQVKTHFTKKPGSKTTQSQSKISS